MSGDMMFKVKISATGEVRDKDGNLLSSSPVEGEMVVSASDLKAQFDLTDDQIRELSESGGAVIHPPDEGESP